MIGLETGKCDPSLPLAFRIARLFVLPIEQIFTEGPSGGEPQGMAPGAEGMLCAARRGRSSEVERQLPKLNVGGSIPPARSNPLPARRRTIRRLRTLSGTCPQAPENVWTKPLDRLDSPGNQAQHPLTALRKSCFGRRVSSTAWIGLRTSGKEARPAFAAAGSLLGRGVDTA